MIGWAGFALLSRPLVAMLGRSARWPRFIAAWNWCNVAQYCLLMAACVPELAGAPVWMQQAAGLVALGWALWLEWYATRLALEIAPVQAAGLVLVDVVIEMLIAGTTEMGSDDAFGAGSHDVSGKARALPWTRKGTAGRLYRIGAYGAA